MTAPLDQAGMRERHEPLNGYCRYDGTVWPCDAIQALEALGEVVRDRDAAIRHEQLVMAAAAANVFSREIDSLGELEKFELGQKIEEEAAMIRAGATEGT